MVKIQRIKDSSDSMQPLRVWKRQGNKLSKRSPNIVVGCGCCHEKVVIYFDDKPTGEKNKDTLEINGVIGTVEQWSKVLLPLLGLDK
jgi:hypothetical protein